MIVQLEGLELALDGSMADYCDILRTHSSEDTLNVQVVRFATEEVWEGQINGRELALSFSFRQEGQEDLEPDASGTTYSSYVRIDDDLEAIAMEVPAEWAQVDGSPWINDAGDTTAAMLQASIDHARDDMGQRRLVEERVEAQRVIEALHAALAADGDELLSPAERAGVEDTPEGFWIPAHSAALRAGSARE